MTIQLLPADGWYFKQEKNSEIAIYRLAAWGLDEDGDVVGFVSREAMTRGPTLRRVMRHETGTYVHESSLSEGELESYLRAGM